MKGISLPINTIVIVAIAVELFALYRHVRLENRMDDHISEIDERLIRSDEMIKNLDDHMAKLTDHMTRLDEHMSKFNEYVVRLDEHIIGFDEHVNRLDDFIIKSYTQTKNEVES